METTKFKPIIQAADGTDLFEGYMEARIPGRKKRLEYAKKKMKLAQSEKVGDEKLSELDDKFDYLDQIFDECFTSMDLTHIETGKKITKKSDLDYIAEGQAVINALTSVCTNGVELGKILS